MSDTVQALKAHMEQGGGRFVAPFLLRQEDDQVVLGHVACARVASSGALSPDGARELAAALLEYAALAEAWAPPQAGGEAAP